MSKFEKRTPVAEYDTSAQIGDVERCLIDAEIAPSVYRQPDRPDDVTMLWTTPEGITQGRVDLHALKSGTHIRGWLAEKSIRKCAP